MPAGSTPTTPWKFEGIPQGQRGLLARGIVDNGNKILELPHRGECNQNVNISLQQTTNIGASFVAEPNLVKGRLTLYDVAGETDLKGIQSGPFTDLSYGLPPGSYMIARGRNTVVSSTPACVLRGCGTGGLSLGELTGTYDPAQHSAALSYELLLAGLSPDNGGADGKDSCRTPWEMSGAYLTMQASPPGSGYCRSSIRFQQDFPLYSEVGSPPVEYPSQTICFGEIGLEIRADPTIGAIYSPNLGIYPESSNSVANASGSIYSYDSGYARGIPDSQAQRASVATVAATLPEGLRYRVVPDIRFRPAGQTSGPDSYISLNRITLPQQGVLGCGDISFTCVTVSDEQGNYNYLTIDFYSEPDYCLQAGPMQLDVGVSLSDGGNVTLVKYLLDVPNIDTADLNTSGAVVICSSNCGPNFRRLIDLPSLPAGPHALKILAQAANGCTSSRIYNFNVRSQPITLQCPADFSVQLSSGETSIAASDLRVANRLIPVVSGGCGPPFPEVFNDAPTVFATGQTEVHYWSLDPGLTPCSTMVTVNPPIPPKKHTIAFTAGPANERKLKLYHAEDASLRWEKPVQGPYWVEFSPDGKRIAACERHGNSGKIRIFGVSAGDSLLDVNVSGYFPTNLSFNPKNENYYAVVEAAPPSYRIALYKGESPVLVTPPMTVEHMGGLDLAWSGDGRRLSVIYSHLIRDSLGNLSRYRILLREWQLGADGQVTQMGTINQLIESNLQEAIDELLYKGTRRIFASSKGIFEVQSQGTIQSLIELNNERIDMDPQAGASAVIRNERLGLIHLGPPVTQRWGQPLPVRKASGIALSSDRKLIAVGATDRVLIFAPRGAAGFSLVREISDVAPYHIAFKPDEP